jgi:hypothetical protein
MSQNTRQEVLLQMRRRYWRAGRRYKSQLVTELVERFGYHRKAALRALRPKPVLARAPFVRGRPKEYSPDQRLPPLKAIWLAALQPCGVRLKACLPEWLADDEADHRRLEADVRQSLLSASRATLDRLLIPARIAHRRRATTRPGSLLRGEIPLRTDWPEAAPGYLELDTVALCGGSLDDRHGWRLDAVDTCLPAGRSTPPGASCAACPTAAKPVCAGKWTMCASGCPSRCAGWTATCLPTGRQWRRVHQPSTGALLTGTDPPIHFTRCRPYQKHDQAHIEQKNFTNVRL